MHIPVAVPIDEIVSISKITGRADEGGFEVVGFTVCYIEHLKNFQLRRAMTQFLSSPEEGEEWSKNLQEALDMGKFQRLWLLTKRCLLSLLFPISDNQRDIISFIILGFSYFIEDKPLDDP